ncbi:MAG: molybdopterin-dependent oxidoreductase [Flavobacteriales bacterium]|nr:putative formate dehydrogenase [Flavobacteriales bacterium]MCC6577495.1 molybdopterin-dependent oxidoreductase [Flavobacteriales bacterium]NUQ14216.1 molybdopterin-dependent oxidoreductase [Flavobacteriales bacterium]
MNTPQAKHGTAAAPVARTQGAPTTSNQVAADVDVAFIDGQAYPIRKGETMLAFMRRHIGPNPVPTLCDAPNLEPFGSCRVCSVEVALQEDGPSKVMASCHTPVGKGMYITTNSPRMERLRRNIVELVLTDYDTERLKTEDHGRNELYNVVQQVGFDIDSVRYPKGRNHLDTPMDTSHPYMVSDLSACIGCFRCVRACDEVQGEMVLTMAGRGFDNHIVKGTDESFFDSDCVSCGACAQACPTSAITDVFRSKENIPDKVVRTVCTYCGVGCNLEVNVKDEKVVSIRAPYSAEANQGHTCLKGRYAFSFYDHPDRLRTPLIKRNGTFEPATWDEAYAFIVDRLARIREEHGPDAIAGISSARCPNEENYLMQKFMRAVVGTNNIDCCARVCHSPTALGMQQTYGTGAATNSIDDLSDTDTILLIGANPTDAHPVTGARIKQQVMKGKTLIVIDPRRIHLARYATHHLQLRPGTNVALLNMMMHYIIKEDLVDKEFIARRTEGWEAFRKELLALDVDRMEQVTGVDREQVRRAAIAYAKSPAAMSFHGLGVTEHSQGTFTVMQIADLAMMTGNIGRRGVGVNPLRGQNNVQGAADMGAQPHQGAGYLEVEQADVNRIYREHYGVPVPDRNGWKIPEMFDAAIEGRLKALWLIGEDVVQTDPNTNKVIRAMEGLDLLVMQEIFMTETARYADVILPGATFLEKSGTFTNGERRVQRVQAAVDPLPGTRSDGQIIVDITERLAERLGLPNPFSNGRGAAPSIAKYQQQVQEGGRTVTRTSYHPAWALKEISAIVPFFKGIRWENLGDNGKQWPVAADGTDTKILHTETFKRGKGRFIAPHWQESREVLDHGKDYPYIITTNRELEHYNSGTMTRRTANSTILTEDVLMIHPEDAAKHGIAEGDMVCVESPRGKVDIKARITDEVRPGILSSTFHFPEIMLNVITSDVHDSEAKCPEYKVVSCRIRKARKAHTRNAGEVLLK